MIKSNQNNSYILSPAGNMLFSRIVGSFSFLHIPNFILGDRTASAKSVLLPAFWQGNNQLSEVAEWSQLDLSSRSRILSSPIFSSERLLLR
jgi:hypothetical protein